MTNLSFIPSTVKEWNKFYTAITKLDSLSKFKNALCLNSQSNKISVAKLYYYGPRKVNVILAQFRCTASFLNHDLFKVNILSRPECSCSAPQRRCKPLLFWFYQLFWNLSQLINTSLISSGSETLSYEDNCLIFYSVIRCITRNVCITKYARLYKLSNGIMVIQSNN